MAMHAGGLMVEARFAYESGDIERAKRLCSMILQLLPSSAERFEAAAYLGLTQSADASSGRRGAADAVRE